jgi:hypothetical protein
MAATSAASLMSSGFMKSGREFSFDHEVEMAQ